MAITKDLVHVHAYLYIFQKSLGFYDPYGNH